MIASWALAVAAVCFTVIVLAALRWSRDFMLSDHTLEPQAAAEMSVAAECDKMARKHEMSRCGCSGFSGCDHQIRNLRSRAAAARRRADVLRAAAERDKATTEPGPKGPYR